MKKKIKIIGIVVISIGLIAFITTKFWAQVAGCVEYTESFIEDFSTVDYRDDATSCAHWGEGYISLSKLGSNFDIANPDYFPDWINTVTAADFNNDGWPDIIGSSSSYSNVLAFVENMGHAGQVGTFEITYWIDGSAGSGGYPTLGVDGAAIDGSGHCGITSGDYDGDGDVDFFFITSNTSSPFSFKRIWLYENELADTGTMTFTQIDKTAAWDDTLLGIAWSATMMESFDFDGDGDIDILMANRAGQVILIKNNGNNKAISKNKKWGFSIILSRNWPDMGISTLSVRDFDNDGDLDIIIGRVHGPELEYYKNDGTGVFTLYQTIVEPDFAGAATVSVATDFDKDGDIDLMIGTDNWNYSPGGEEIGGQAFYFRNDEGSLVSRFRFDDRPTVFDFDLGCAFDFDRDGDDDILMADGNHSERYYLFINDIADVYNTYGEGISTNISGALDYSQHAITKVEIVNLDQRVMGGTAEGLAIDFYVSNNDGLNWEFYNRFEGNDIHAYNSPDALNLPVHTFKHYGAKLRWKAVMTAEEDPMVDYENASFETPRIDLIEFQYTYVDRKEYSRTSVAVNVVDDSGIERELIIGGTFYYPGWEGHIRAYDVTDMALSGSSYSELKTITRSDPTDPTGREIVAAGVNIRWDAGELLAARSAANRNIYTAIPDNGGLARIDFSDANAALLEPILDDYNGETIGLINFVRGEGRNWKLGDINHSNPIVVGPPDGIASLKGSGYDAFFAAHQDRTKVMIVGSNDGMLHCFDVLTGEELWGFIPYNLLPRLKEMWQVDPSTGERFFDRKVYVDGSPMVDDVYTDGAWRTILICGQGPGKGSTLAGGTTGNFYFALDITDPANPQPLWEFTHDTMGESWSIPVIGKIDKGSDTWVCFVGSGYDNYALAETGDCFYAVDLAVGEAFWYFDAGQVNTITAHGFTWDIPNSIPGTPSQVDIDDDGLTDRVYVGDLEGRIWKVDVTPTFVDAGSWTAEVLYEDFKNYPIISNAAVWISASGMSAMPHIYFGTGGDDRAPNDVIYSFIGLMDNEAGTQEERVEWYMGDPAELNLDPAKDVGDLAVGEKVWADPKIADYTVYFNTLTGSIESVDPCENIAGAGQLYARFIVSKGGTAVGGTAIKTAGGTVENLSLSIKTRSAVSIGEQGRSDSGVKKRSVYIQEYDSTIQRLEQATGGMLAIKSWREVFKIIK